MGHIRLGVLPKSPTWRSVISELDAPNISSEELGNAVLENSKDILASESSRSSVEYCIWLLAQLTLASKSDDFRGNLGKIGLNVDEETSAVEFFTGISRMSNNHLTGITPRTAINNIANLALRETLTHSITRYTNTLFGSNLSDVQSAIKKYSTQKEFGKLLHTFFTAFLQRTIRLVVDKEIANHIGPENSFQSIQELDDFEAKLSVFSGQTSKIVDTFSSGWYSKKIWQEGTITKEEARKFVFVALKKLRSDLEISGGQR